MTRSTAILRTAIGAAVLVAMCSVAVSRPPKSRSHTVKKVADLDWMSGNWEDRGDGFTQEIWSKPLGGAMNGMCRIGDSRERVTYEMMLLEDDADGVVLRMMHFGAKLAPREDKPITFRVVGSDRNEVTFETMETAGPTRLVYRLPSEDSLTVRLEKTRGGKRQAFDFKFSRAK